MTFPIIFPEEENTKFTKAIKVIQSIIDKEHQSVSAVIQLLVIESFGTPHDSDVASEILTPIRKKYKFA